MSERFLFFLALLTACSAQTYSENAPSWVNSLRGGNSTLRLTNGDKVLFRSNYKGGKTPIAKRSATPPSEKTKSLSANPIPDPPSFR